MSSGVRSVFCYCPTARLESWKPFKFGNDPFPKWMRDQLDELAANGPFGNGRVSIGFAFDNLFLPKDELVDIFEHVKALGIKVITTHYVRNTISS